MKRLFFLVFLLAATSASAQLYRWVDQSGKVHYTDTPPQPSAAKSVEKKKLGGSVVEPPQLPFQLQLAVRNFPVTLYTSPTCKDGCPQARELLQKRGVPFQEVIVEDTDSNALLKKASGSNQVPTMVMGSQVEIGYSIDGFNKLLDSAGYPKTAIILPAAAKALAPVAKIPPPTPPADPAAPAAPSTEPASPPTDSANAPK